MKRYTLALVGKNDARLEVLASVAMNHPLICDVKIIGEAPGLRSNRDVEQADYAAIAQVPEIAEDMAADVVIIGSENDIATGLPGMLRNRGIACVGPELSAYMNTEGCKMMGSETCDDAGIPCPAHVSFVDYDQAVEYVERFFSDPNLDNPLVVKGTWELGGKGVVVAQLQEVAIAHLHRLFHGDFPSPINGGPRRVQFQEYVRGRERSYFGAIHGSHATDVCCGQDYKLRFGEGDDRIERLGNVNTGGMGAYYVPWQNEGSEIKFGNEIAQKLAEHLANKMHMPYSGFIFPGTKGGKVLEFGARAPLPELVPIAAALKGTLIDMALFAAGLVSEVPEIPRPNVASVCIVKVTGGYGFQKAKGGQIIRGLEDAASDPRIRIFHGASYYDGKNWRVKQGGGRVIFIGATVENGDLQESVSAANHAAEIVYWNDTEASERDDHRHDIAVDEILSRAGF